MLLPSDKNIYTRKTTHVGEITELQLQNSLATNLLKYHLASSRVVFITENLATNTKYKIL